MIKATISRSADRAAAARIATQLAALEQMTTKELQAKFLELFGYPTRTASKPNLRKRLAWKLQEREYGGLSAQALARIEELAPLAPARWNRPPERDDDVSATRAAPRATAPRDPRLPAPGTVLTRTHGGVEHKVTVLEAGFEYGGETFKSLSAVARKVTATPWNGFLFFGVRAEAAKAEA